jgi:hypothetical protein
MTWFKVRFYGEEPEWGFLAAVHYFSGSAQPIGDYRKKTKSQILKMEQINTD